jgi:hypothetical protein
MFSAVIPTTDIPQVGRVFDGGNPLHHQTIRRVAREVTLARLIRESAVFWSD